MSEQFGYAIGIPLKDYETDPFATGEAAERVLEKNAEFTATRYGIEWEEAPTFRDLGTQTWYPEEDGDEPIEMRVFGWTATGRYL